MCRLLLLLLAIFLAGPSLAQAPRLHAVIFDVAPYAWTEKGRPEGRYVRVLHELLDPAGIAVDIELQPFARIPLSLREEHADLTLAFPTAGLRESAQEIGPVLLIESLVVTRKARPVSRLEGLKGAVIGRARGGCLDLADRADLELRWTDVSSFESALRMLEVGRLDGLCLTRDVLRHYGQKLGIERAQLGSELVVGQRTVMMFARRDLPEPMVRRLQALLAQRPPRRGE